MDAMLLPTLLPFGIWTSFKATAMRVVEQVGDDVWQVGYQTLRS